MRVSPNPELPPTEVTSSARPLLKQWMHVHRVELLLFLLLWATFGYFYQSTQHNEAARFDQTRAIVEDRTLAINKYWWNSADVINFEKNGQNYIYPNKAPGTTLLAVIPFLLSSLFLKLFVLLGLPEWVYWHFVAYLTTIFTVSLLSALAAVAMFGVLRRMTLDISFSVLIVLAIWLGTIAFPFSTLFFSHQLAAALLTVAFYLLFKIRWEGIVSVRRPGAHLCAAGLLMGFSVTTEYPTALLAGPLSVYTVWAVGRSRVPWRRKTTLLGMWALGTGIGVSALILYNLAAFGKLFYLPYEAYLKANSPFPTYTRGFLGLSWPGTTQFLHAVASITLRPPIGILYIGVEDWRVYACNPVLWLVLPGLAIMLWRRPLRPEGVLVAAMTAVYILFIASYGTSIYDWSGASYLGPRHIIPLLPFLALPLYYGARKLRFAFYPLLAISVFYMLLATAIEPRMPVPFANPARDSLAPDYLRGRLAQNTDALFDPEHRMLTKDSTAFNLGKLARLPGRSQLIPLMLWWFIIGGALLFAAARRHALSLTEQSSDIASERQMPDPSPPRAPPRAVYSPRVAELVLFIFVCAIALAPVLHYASNSPRDGVNGLLGKYYRNVNWAGEPAEIQVDETIDFNWSNSFPLPPPFSVDWTGSLTVDQPGDHVFALICDDGSSLEINGHLVVDASAGPVLEKKTGTINLPSGIHTVRLRYFNGLFGGSVRLFWTPPGRSEQIIPSEALRPPPASPPSNH